jgi:two-component system response regulator AdeR
VSEQATVLIVDDEPSLIEIFAYWLDSDYEVWTAENGTKALEVVDEDVDVMLLDRLMPGMTGDAVIDAVRERNLDCTIVMATAVESDLDTITAGAGAYLTKPITNNELLTTISRVLDRQEYAEFEQEYFDLLSECANQNETAVRNSEEYAELETRIEELSEKLDVQTETMEDDEFVSLMYKTS